MTIDRFSGTYRWLSNFWPCTVTLDGEEYRSVEHAYQAAKTLDPEERLEFRRPDTTAAIAKQLGRHVTQRWDWPMARVAVMTQLTFQKFRDHPELGALLLATGDEELVEGNTWGDHFWGVCEGQGTNHLGRILMTVRHVLRQLPAKAEPEFT